ncbi:MAG: hypothetical protein U5K74_01605 [Gemmatimonadaceae bacterium]|nr:hypothetical protein [Gemmatimonadaceae bacterium]
MLCLDAMKRRQGRQERDECRTRFGTHSSTAPHRDESGLASPITARAMAPTCRRVRGTMLVAQQHHGVGPAA